MQEQLFSTQFNSSSRTYAPLFNVKGFNTEDVWCHQLEQGLIAMQSLNKARSSSETAKPPYQERLRGKNVIVVEDELLISMEMEMSLEECGSNVIGSFPSVAGFLDVCDQLSADAAILDVNLNGVMVFPVADYLVKRNIPFLFHTGNADYEQLATLYPGAPIIKKPADLPVLLETIADLL